jgi:SAM-dependent methyltransferase
LSHRLGAKRRPLAGSAKLGVFPDFAFAQSGLQKLIFMSRHIAQFGMKAPEPSGLDAPAFHRNHEPIWSVLSPFLQGSSAHVLELGSGTGQHVAEFARRAPHLVWWPSDCDETCLRSIAAWRAHAQLANLKPPLRIDIERPEWELRHTECAEFTAIVCINVLHIAPWRVSQGLMAGAARYLSADGRLFVYGPFMRDGRHTAPSNAAFDLSLQRQNPEWGLRDVADLAALANRCRLELLELTQMPANNLVLTFERRAA